MLDGRPPRDALEIACYTDAAVPDECVQVGPYALIGVRGDFDASLDSMGRSRFGLALRLSLYRSTNDPDSFVDEDWEQTNSAIFHGGDAGQELASLVSLALGIRLRAAGICRLFIAGEDPGGLPFRFQDPGSHPPLSLWSPILPRQLGESVALADCKPLLVLYPSLSAQQAGALVRAARSYQEGLWVAESDPRQAWLRLVSSVEAAAQEWPAGAQLRPTRRFIEFIEAFKPHPPLRRPRVDRLNWNRMREHVNTIYDCRSRDLHDGKPIPPPMCQPPYSFRRVPNETPSLPPASSWTLEQVPTLLHMFEYIVRNALLTWWRSITT